MSPTASPGDAKDRTHRSRESLRLTLSWTMALPILATCWILYTTSLHPWLMHWGATPLETVSPLAGDTLQTTASTYFTRAITIEAPPARVWPWVVQMGQDRAGFYSNSWLENLTTANIHNASELHPKWQYRAIGDTVPLARPDLLFGLGSRIGHTNIVTFFPELVIADIPGRFVLLPIGGNRTRLLFRETYRSQGPLIIRALIWDPLHFVMVQRMLRGIRERAEGAPLISSGLMSAARTGWVIFGAALLALFGLTRRLRPWLLLPAVFSVIVLLTTSDWEAALAGSIAIGITISGAVLSGRSWWPTYSLIVSAVLLSLVAANDAYTVFGIALGVIAVGTIVMAGGRILALRPTTRVGVYRTRAV